MRAGPCLGPLSLPLDQTPPSFDIQIISAILEGLVITAEFGKVSFIWTLTNKNFGRSSKPGLRARTYPNRP
jgi:hypothetical protein